jgi:hypothetical protein
MNTLFGQIPSSTDGPLHVLIDCNGIDEADDGIVVGEHPDDIGAPFDLPPLARTGQSPTSQPFIWTKSADATFASMQKYWGR